MTRSDSGVAARTVRRLRVIWLAPVLALLSLSAWAFASPVGASPDDDFHQVSIWCANDARTELCLPGADEYSRVVPPALLTASCYAFDPEASAGCQEGIWQQEWVQTDRGNFYNTYPPVYYATMNLFATPDMQTSVLVMRLVNAAIFVGLSSLLWWLLPPPRRTVLAVQWLITLVPLGLFTVASVNPSSWAITGVGLGWLAMLGFLESRGGWRGAALGGLAVLATGMALASRPDAAVYAIIGLGIAGVLAWKSERAVLIRLVLPLVLAVLAAIAFLSSTQSGVAVTGLGSADSALGAGTSPINLVFFNLLGVPQLWIGVFGFWGLGWLDTVMTPIVWVSLFAVFSGVILWSLRRVPARIGWLMGGLLVVMWLLPTYVLTAGGNIVGQNVQPRYILPVLVLLAGLAMLPWRRAPLVPSLAQAIVLGTLVAGAQFVALFTNVRRYIIGEDGGSGFDLDGAAEWWWTGLPLGPTAIWLIGGLAFAGLAAILVREWRKTDGVV